MKKRISALILCFAMALSICACSGEKNGQGNTQLPAGQTEVNPPTVKTLAAFDDFATVLKGDYEITDEDVATYFTAMLCGEGAGLVEVTDRDVVQKGDVVKVNYSGYHLDAKEPFEGGTAKNQIIDVSGNCAFDEATGSVSNTYIPGFSDGLVGAKIGEKVNHNVKFPSTYSEKTLAGKETRFEFTVEKIYIKKAPANTTDEYVAKYLSEQGFTTVDALVAHSKEELVASGVMNYVISKSEINVPEEYLNSRLTIYEEAMLKTSGQKDLETLAYYYFGSSVETLRASWLQSIKQQIIAEVVLAEMVKSKDLEHNQADLDEFVEEILGANSSFASEDEIYMAIGYGNTEAGKECLLNEFAIKNYLIEKYRASQAVTE